MEKIDSLASQVNIENIMKTVKEILVWERLSGSEEELMAFRYLERSLNELGVETKLIFHDAYISIPLESELIINGKKYPCRAPSMGKSTSEEGLNGELLYINHLRKLSVDLCKDKIIMIDGRATYKNVNAAAKVGAKAVICIQQNRINECIASNAWGSPTRETKKLIPDIVSISIDNKSFEEIMPMLKDNLNARIVTNVDTGWRKIPLLIGEIKAFEETEKYVMFSGHVDSWYHGAMDNGTVNSLQVEIARIAKLNRNKLKRNLKVVFFSGHSHGRYAGSTWYADNNWLDLHYNCVINVNADSIGAKGAEIIVDSMIMPESKDLAVEIIKNQTGQVFMGSRFEKKADQSFWNVGVTSAFASFSKQTKKEITGNNLGWWWHTKEDTIDKIDSGNLFRDAKIFTSYIFAFLTFDILPLNFIESSKEIKECLVIWNKKAKGKFELNNSIELAKKLVEVCKKFYLSNIDDYNMFNEVLLKLGRILVPLNFTTGNIYVNDSGNVNGCIPSLSLIDKLSETSDLNEEMELITELKQNSNYVEHSLIKALMIIESYLNS